MAREINVSTVNVMGAPADGTAYSGEGGHNNAPS
jgi:hypothetical protein